MKMVGLLFSFVSKIVEAEMKMVTDDEMILILWEKEIEKVELTKLRIVAFILIIALTMIEMIYDR